MGEGMSRRPVILAVDDTEADLDVLVEALSDDYEVMVAMDGQAALHAVVETSPDLILLDVMMPAMDGYEVCRRLKADPATAAIPVIFVTAMNDVADETKGFELGAVDYISKPISPPIVLARLGTHLALRQAYLDLAFHHEELKKFSRLRDEVERMSRHDLKTPLTAVINVPDLLLGELELSPDQREMLQVLKQSGFRMLQIINSSLDLYKMETGRYQFCPIPVDLAPLLDQIFKELGELMLAKSITVRTLLEGKPLAPGQGFRVAGEETVLYTMLANLIKNAVEASPTGEFITVHLAGGDQVVIKIHNLGAVPAELRGRFFDKFATAGKRGGTGLGTYTAKLIAQTLGGSIGFTTSEELGTTLAIRLAPAQDEVPLLAPGAVYMAAPGGPAGHPPRQPGQGPSILIVDDYANMRSLTKSILRRLGYDRIHEAADGQKALALIRGSQVDLVISDVNMPNMSGLELLEAVRQDPRTSAIPFIIITGEADKNTILEAARAKVSGYLLKPFSPDALKARIEMIMPRVPAC